VLVPKGNEDWDAIPSQGRLRPHLEYGPPPGQYKASFHGFVITFFTPASHWGWGAVLSCSIIP